MTSSVLFSGSDFSSLDILLTAASEIDKVHQIEVPLKLL